MQYHVRLSLCEKIDCICLILSRVEMLPMVQKFKKKPLIHKKMQVIA
jgi:hypothetical protein